MKRLITLYIILSSTFCAYSQDVEKTITLEGVTVKAAKVVNKADGMIIYPTDVQKQASNNGYNILEKLTLANLRIDNISHSITAIDNRGGVQIRINGIVVGKSEMLALNPKDIAKIVFINNPGVRYGDGIAYVIDIVTRKNESGYTVGTDLTSALTTLQGDDIVYGKWNKGKSEFSFSYDISGYRTKGEKSKQSAEYTLTDGSIYTIERKDVESLRKSIAHDAKLTYNWADSTATVFQASLSGTFNNTPDNYTVKDIVDGTRQYKATSRAKDKSYSPILDLYFFRQITPRQSITANTVGTYISTQTSSFYDEGTPYKYDVDGKTASLLTEVVYENRLKPFTLSTGLNNSYKYIKNDYLGDASSLTKTNNNRLYAFAEIKGMFQPFSYTLGMGASYIHYTQNGHRYNFWTFHPKASLTYRISNSMQLSYTYQMQDKVSRIAMTSDAMVRTNSMEWTVGNPDLKPSHDMEHRLQFSYTNNRLQTFVEGYYKQCLKPNMAHYERTDDNKFIYTQINQKEIDVLNIMAYASYWLLPEKLQIAANGGIYRCFNFGYDYTHCYTSWFYASSITAYLGNFTLQGYVDNGNRFLEGESKGYNGAYSVLKASYTWRDLQFSLSWANPFMSNYKSYENELLNCNLYKHTIGYSKANSNMISLNISWRLSRGSKHKSAEKTINLRDTDNGIILRPHG
ncbi:MAG: outer membrane beta-barrel family protein [Prevotella sp.]|uniref:TonB-dependent receptor n=1 Tax=Prevotella sp. TaxID=59823 RepID=UPI0025F3F69B|nr:TonB-dependent receptor [Prevotella sp.]MCI7119107.1 outer membrane beta-barrel family protein [Prevotella sp.]